MNRISLSSLQAEAEAYQSRYAKAKTRLEEFKERFGSYDDPIVFAADYKKLDRKKGTEKTSNDRDQEEYLWFLKEQKKKEVENGYNEIANDNAKIKLQQYLQPDFYRAEAGKTWNNLKKSATFGLAGTTLTAALTATFNNQPLIEIAQNQASFLLASAILFTGAHRLWTQKTEAENKIGYGFHYDLLDIGIKLAFNKTFTIPAVIAAGIAGYFQGVIMVEHSDPTFAEAANPLYWKDIFRGITYPVVGTVAGGTNAAIAALTVPFTLLPVAHGTIGLARDFLIAGIGGILNRQTTPPQQAPTHKPSDP